MDDEPQWAWAAGLFEGEGTIAHGRDRRGPWRTRRLQITSTDRDVLERFVALVGAGTFWTDREGNRLGSKPVHRVHISAWRDIERILQRFMPYLGERRAAKARVLLADPPAKWHGRNRAICAHGHAMTDENTYAWRSQRFCRECARRRNRAYRTRLRHS